MIPCLSLNQELTAGTPDREKRQRDETQLDPAEDATLLRAVTEQISALRKTRGSLKARKNASNRDLLVTTNSILDEALSRAEALSEKILPGSITPPVKEAMWKRSKQETLYSQLTKTRAVKTGSGPLGKPVLYTRGVNC